MTLRRLVATLRLWALEARDIALGAGMGLAVFLVRLLPERRAADVAGWAATRVGMLLPVSRRVGLPNLRLAFPEKSEGEREAILRECWDNLGRTAVEYCHLDRIWDLDPKALRGERVETFSPQTAAIYDRLRDDGRPAIIIAAHLANWELPMLAAAAHGLEAAALYRAPANRWVARWVLGQRRVAMGELVPSGLAAPHRLSALIAEGKHAGMLTDQYAYRGALLPFFGHNTLTNQLFARLARLHDCPVHAVRVVRLAGDRFRIELTEELPLPRDAEGRIDLVGAGRVMNALFEGWIREHPGQWLWLARKWRGD